MSTGQKPCEAELLLDGPFHQRLVFSISFLSSVSLSNGNNKKICRVTSWYSALVTALQVQLPGSAFPQCPLLLALKNPFRSTSKKGRKKKSLDGSIRHRKSPEGEMLFMEPQQAHEMQGFLEGGKCRVKSCRCSWDHGSRERSCSLPVAAWLREQLGYGRWRGQVEGNKEERGTGNREVTFFFFSLG